MEKVKGSISIFLEVYKVIILTVIAILLFISLFDVSIEKKTPIQQIDDLPKVEVDTKDNGITISADEINQQLLRAKKNRDELSQHSSTIATECQRYYRTPKNKDGGGLSFIGFEPETSYLNSENGLYSINVENDRRVVITATGVETGKDGINPVRVVCIVNPVVIQTDSEN